MSARLVRSPLARYLSVAALPLVAGAWLATGAAPALADDSSGGPRYTYFDAGYQWVDVNYAVEQDGGQHEGFKVDGSVNLVELGPVGIHAFGEFFDGDFTGVTTDCDNGEGQTRTSANRDSRSIAVGLGVNYRLLEKTDIVLNAAYVDYSEFQIPNSTCQLVSTDDHGYSTEALVRSELSENVEIETGYRYTHLSDSDIGNNDVLLGIGYHATDYLTFRILGIVFDTDTGFELDARVYFDSFLGRDTIF